MRDAAYFAIAFFCSAFIVLRFLTSSSCVLTLGRLAIAPPCTLVRRPFSSIVIKSRRTVDSEASSAVISSCIVALPSASIMDSILEIVLLQAYASLLCFLFVHNLSKSFI